MTEIFTMNNWVPITLINEIPPDIDYINCDTRDFHCILRSQENDGDRIETINKLQNTIDTSKYIQDFNVKLLSDALISTDDILKLLLHIHQRTQKAPSDTLLFGILKYHGYWLKYIRFVRADKDNFYVYTTMGENFYPLNVKELMEI